MKKIIVVVVLFSILLVSTSCNTKNGTISLPDSEIKLYVDETYTIEAKVEGLKKYTLDYDVNNQDVVEVENGVITALKEGSAVVRVFIKDNDNVAAVEIKVDVMRKLEPSVEISGNKEVDAGKEITLIATLTDLDGEVTWETNDASIATVDKGIVKGIKAGKVIITAVCGKYMDTHEVTVIKIEDLEKPEFVLEDSFKERVIISWNETFNPLEGILAVDNVDQDITDKIEVTKSFNNQEYGIQVIELQVEDSSGNINTMEREVEIVWDYDVNFIGHAGSYYGIMNSEEAFLYAVQVLKYQALECDVKQTSDGVFVMSHDDTFNGYPLASTSWSVLKDVEYTASRSAGIPGSNGSVTNSPYTTKLCTLERYLEICKEYNVTAVIELKSSKGITQSDQSRMQALMDEIQKNDMLENTILLGSSYNCLIWTRNNGYEDIPCQYLVNSCESDTILQRCIDNNLDISMNVTGSYSNSDEWIAKYVDAGCKVAVFTFTQYVDYPELQKWIDKGVDYVTCDWHLMSKLNLPKGTKEDVESYEVAFKDFDGTILKTAKVKKGRTAAAPSEPTREGYKFIGWDKEIKNITSNLEVTAQYEIETYTITYDANAREIVEGEWASKEAFITDFYTDFYNWLCSNGKNVAEITVSGSKVTMTKNAVTVSFSSVDELKKIDKADFEKTLSNLIYKPVVRNSDDSCIIESSESYFLNSNAYREKYQALDAWFINCINKNYTTYDKTYTPTSAGKIQIFYRFHQWQQGTSIGPFNILPAKYEIVIDESNQYTLPTTNLTYTVEDSFTLPSASGNYSFGGWYLDKEYTKEIKEITKGSTGNLLLYAKWEK